MRDGEKLIEQRSRPTRESSSDIVAETESSRRQPAVVRMI
jgi:hypothetical protein